MHKYMRTTATFIATGMVALIINHSLTPASASDKPNKTKQNENSGDWIPRKQKKTSLDK